MKSKFDRRNDIVACFGGEEFVIVAQYDDHGSVITRLEEIKEQISQHTFQCGGNQSVSVTISIGVVTAAASYSEKIEEWLRVADKQLYWVKENGRNQMSIKHVE